MGAAWCRSGHVQVDVAEGQPRTAIIVSLLLSQTNGLSQGRLSLPEILDGDIVGFIPQHAIHDLKGLGKDRTEPHPRPFERIV